MVMSMTGYGIDTFHIEDTTITVEIRSVNSRYLDFIPKIPRDLHHLEIDIIHIVQDFFHRGRIEVYISIMGDYLVNKKVHADWELIDQFMDHIKLAQSRYNLSKEIPVSLLTSIDDLYTIHEVKLESDHLKSLLLESVTSA